MIMLKTINPGSVIPGDQWLVFNSAIMREVESHSTKGAAMRACHVLNTHEKANGRPEIFKVMDRITGDAFDQTGL